LKKLAPKPTQETVLVIYTYTYPNLHIIPQTKNPTNVGLDVVERVILL